MTKKDIDTICWWIPFRKLRDAVRNYLNTINEIENKNNILNVQNIRIETRLKLASMSKKIINETRKQKLIISLTTFPERVYDVDVVIYSLLNQSIKADKIILWLSNEEFPNGINDVPEHVVALQKLGLEIDFCNNLRPYNKLIPTLRKYPNDIIVTADDDIYYTFKWLEQLYNAYLDNPSHLHCHLSRRISFDSNNKINSYENWQHQYIKKTMIPSYLNLALGVGGVIYSKNILFKDILDEDKFMKLCPSADDLWFWAMSVLNDTKINLIDSKMDIEKLIDFGIDKTWEKLWETNVSENYNDKQFKELLNFYPELYNKIFGFNSSVYWEDRYKNYGNSGAGSYNRLSVFKSNIINDFIHDNNINTMIEWGCGDGNQLQQFIVNDYIGIDVSQTIISKMKSKFENDKSKSFFLTSDYKNTKADLAVSLDVIYHLIEEYTFNNYMLNLFNSSNKFVIIYSSNKNEYHMEHVKHRKFTDWIDTNKKEWKLYKYIKNIYPEDKSLPNDTSFADFYIFTIR